jgi:uncharacterized membrane protein YjjP (DUF1212 family)
MEYQIFENFTWVDLLVGLFIGFVIYILSTFISVFVRRNKEFMTPVIFGLMYGNYISLRYRLSK